MNSAPSDFWLWLGKFNAEDLTGLVAVVLVFSVAAVAVICWTIYMIHKNRTEAGLKRELLDRGLSADEIAMIIRASRPKVFREDGPKVNARWTR